MSDVFTVRMGFADTGLWSADKLLSLYKEPLKLAGFKATHLPSVAWPRSIVQVTNDDPFAGARSIKLVTPGLSDISQTRDTRVPYAQDPAKLADAGKAFLTLFTWNLTAPTQGAEHAGTLRNLFRAIKPDEGTAKLSPIVKPWIEAPDQLAPYPPKPPLVSAQKSPLAVAAASRPKLGLGSILAIAGGLYLMSKGG